MKFAIVLRGTQTVVTTPDRSLLVFTTETRAAIICKRMNDESYARLKVHCYQVLSVETSTTLTEVK